MEEHTRLIARLAVLVWLSIAFGTPAYSENQLNNLRTIAVTISGFDDGDAKKCGIQNPDAIKTSLMLPVRTYTKIREDIAHDLAYLNLGALILSNNFGCVATLRLEVYTFALVKLRHPSVEASQPITIFEKITLFNGPKTTFYQQINSNAEDFGKAFAEAWLKENK